VPSSPDEAPIPPTPGEKPALVHADGDEVGFLDAPGLDTAALFETVDGVLAGMPDGAVLTVFTDAPDAPAAASDWCIGRGVELLAILRHDERAGATLTLRRVDPPT
jgi:TusA-related sulfurtransferase